MAGAASAADLPGSSSKYCDLAENPVKMQPDVGDDKRKFLGYFDGKWAQQLPHTLIVYEIADDGAAKGYYAWPTHPMWNITVPGCVHFTGKIADSRLDATLSNGARVSYEFTYDNTLEGSYDRGGRVTHGVFERLPQPQE